MDNKSIYFDNTIAVGLRNNGMKEPLIKWYKELFVNYDKTDNQLTLFRTTQSIGLIQDYPQLYQEIILTEEMERGLMIAKATTLKLENASDEVLAEKFGSVERARVALAIGIVQRDKENKIWFDNLEKDEQEDLIDFAKRIAKELKRINIKK